MRVRLTQPVTRPLAATILLREAWTILNTPAVALSSGFFISHITASPDGKLLAYSTGNGSARDQITYFDLTQGKPTKTFNYVNGGSNSVASLQFNAESTRLVASGPMLYDLNGTWIKGIANGGYPVTISPDGSTLYTIDSQYRDKNGTPSIASFDANTLAQKWLSFGVGVPDWSMPLAVSSDGLAFFCPGNTTRGYSTANGSLLPGIFAGRSAVSVAAAPNVNQLLLGPDPQQVWNLDTSQGTGSYVGEVFRGNYAGIKGVSFQGSSGPQPALVSTIGRTLADFFNPANGSVVDEQEEDPLYGQPNQDDFSLDISPDSQYYIGGPIGNNLVIYSMSGNQLELAAKHSSILTDHNGWGCSSAYVYAKLTNGGIYEYSFDGNESSFNANALTFIRQYSPVGSAPISNVLISADGSRVITYQAGAVRVFDGMSGAVLGTISIPSSSSNVSMTLSTGGLLCLHESGASPDLRAEGSDLRRLRASPVLTRTLQSTIQGTSAPVSEDAEISPDGNYVGFIAFPVGGSVETYVQLFRVSDGATVGDWKDQFDLIPGLGTQVAFSPDSQTMAWTSPSDGTIIAVSVPRLAKLTFSPATVQGGALRREPSPSIIP